MIDHITVRVQDIDNTVSFYRKALEPLGYKIGFDERYDDTRIVGFTRDGKMDTWFTNDTPISGPFHLAWAVESKPLVDAFYEAALRAGGKDNGKPGPRPHYHEDYYAAFVIDPNGNNIEAVCRKRVN
jgi:catechol 2,3-dioxygenase-like lactoylglutathione lyase family enzyme